MTPAWPVAILLVLPGFPLVRALCIAQVIRIVLPDRFVRGLPTTPRDHLKLPQIDGTHSHSPQSRPTYLKHAIQQAGDCLRLDGNGQLTGAVERPERLLRGDSSLVGSGGPFSLQVRHVSLPEGETDRASTSANGCQPWRERAVSGSYDGVRRPVSESVALF